MGAKELLPATDLDDLPRKDERVRLREAVARSGSRVVSALLGALLDVQGHPPSLLDLDGLDDLEGLGLGGGLGRDGHLRGVHGLGRLRRHGVDESMGRLREHRLRDGAGLADGAGLGRGQLQDRRPDVPLDVGDALGGRNFVQDARRLRLVVGVEHAAAVAVRLVVVAVATGTQPRRDEQAADEEGEERSVAELRTELVGGRGLVHLAPRLDGLGLLT